MSRSASDADDLVSEGFARVLASIDRGSGPEVAFRPYLLSTIRRLAYDRTNRERRETPVEYDLEEVVEPARDPVVEGFERDTAAAAFASLPERWRMVLWHTEVEGQAPAEVASLLGIKPNAVAALAYRAREGLRQAYLSQHATAAPLAASECRLTNDRLAAHVRGGLTVAQEARVEAHLESCEDCQAAYLELTSVNTSMRSLIGLALLGPMASGYLADVVGGTGTSGVVAGSALRGSGPRRLAGHRRARIGGAVGAVGALFLAGILAANQSTDRPLALGAPASARSTVPVTPSTGGVAPGTAGTGAEGPGGQRRSGQGGDPPASPLSSTSAVPAPTATLTMPPTTLGPSSTTPVAPSQLTLGLASAGPLVAGRPGVLVASVGNTGASQGRAVRVDIELSRMTLRGLPVPASGSPLAGASPNQSCAHASASRLVCTLRSVAPGAHISIFVPVAVQSTVAPVRMAGHVEGTQNAAGADSDPVVEFPVNAGGMAARFATIARGDVISLGNTLLTCDEAEAGCSQARSRVGSGGRLDNGAYNMVPVDVDGDLSTANSSSARLDLPAGSRVLSAQLYVAGDLLGPVPSPNPAANGRVVIRSPRGLSTPVNAERVDVVGSSRYQDVVDVTDIVRRGGAGRWTVGGAQLATGSGAFGGWSLIVVVADPAAPLRSMVVLDGLTSVNDTDLPPFVVGGFTVPPSGHRAATLHTVAFEGDAGIGQDQLSLAGRPVTDAANPLGNTFNSSASNLGSAAAGVFPAAGNLFGVDVDRFDVSDRLVPGSTTATIGLTTTQDVFLLGAAAFTVDQ